MKPEDSIDGEMCPDAYCTTGTSPPSNASAMIATPPIRALHRKRGKSMSRRKGQNPKLRIGTRTDGTQYFYIHSTGLMLQALKTGSVGERFSGPSKQSQAG